MKNNFEQLKEDFSFDVSVIFLRVFMRFDVGYSQFIFRSMCVLSYFGCRFYCKR